MNSYIVAKLESLRRQLDEGSKSQGKSRLEEAEEIDFRALPSAKLAEVEKLVKALGLKKKTAWEGLNGFIVEFDVPGQTQKNWRLSVDDFKLIANIKGLRWVEMSPTKLNIGF